MTGLAVTSRSGAVLKTPIAREDWELKNDDVQLVEKIGRGNFGDVYKGGLISESSLTLVPQTNVPNHYHQLFTYILSHRGLKLDGAIGDFAEPL